MPQREPHVERIIRFVAFAPSQPPAAAEAAALDLTEGLLAFLLGASAAADRAVRFRACQLMGAIFTSLPDVELTDVSSAGDRCHPGPHTCQLHGSGDGI
jgi:hypothetical protein